MGGGYAVISDKHAKEIQCMHDSKQKVLCFMLKYIPKYMHATNMPLLSSFNPIDIKNIYVDNNFFF